MTTPQLAILNAMKAVLLAGTAVASGHVTKGRSRPISTEFAQAVNLNLITSAAAIGLTGGRTGWMTSIDVECYGRGNADTEPQDAVDPLLQEVYGRLLADNTLGGLAADINPAEGDTLAWEFDQQADNLCKCTARFMVLHMNADRTLS